MIILTNSCDKLYRWRGVGTSLLVGRLDLITDNTYEAICYNLPNLTHLIVDEFVDKPIEDLVLINNLIVVGSIVDIFIPTTLSSLNPRLSSLEVVLV